MGDHNELSPEEKEVNKLISEARARISDIEKQLKDLPREHGPRPEYNLPGGPQPSAGGKNVEITRAGNERITAIRDKLAESVDKTLANSSKEIKDSGRNNLTSFLNPEKADKNVRSTEKTLDAAGEFAMQLRYGGDEKNKSIPDHERAQVKDLDSSQEFAMKLRYDKKPDNPNKEDKVQPKEMSMSMQFEQSLQYPQLDKEGDDDRNDKGKEDHDKEPDKD